VSFVGESSGRYESIGVGMFKYPSLVGIFPLLAPNTTPISLFNVISSDTRKSHGSYDPWVLPHPSQVESYKVIIPLSPTELSYSVYSQ
jgi:hypothetical protein